VEKTYALICILLVQAHLPAMGGNDPALKSNVQDWIQNSGGLRFIENKGQMADLQDGYSLVENRADKCVGDTNLLFKSSGAGMEVYVTSWGLSYVFTKSDKNAIPTLDNFNQLPGGDIHKKERITTQYCRADMELVGADIRKENVIKESESEDHTDYYLAHCPDGIMNVHSYEKITVKNIYPGIDWVLYSLAGVQSNESGVPSAENVSSKDSELKTKDSRLKTNTGGLKYDFVVHPGADPSLIKLRYKWTDKPSLQKDGSLKIHTPMGDIVEGSPLSYLHTKEQKINTRYSLHGDEIGFILDNYDKAETLIIDPVLTWATYYGGTIQMEPSSIKSDKSNVWVTGPVQSSGFPIRNPGGLAYFMGTFKSSSAVIIIEFNSCGKLIWATYYGGSAGQSASTSISSDGANVWVTGETSSTDFPTQFPAGSYQQPALGVGASQNAFLLQFSCTTNARIWATYYGGSKADQGNSICSDGKNVWVTGWTSSTDFPTQFPAGSYNQAALGAGAIQNAFILQFSCANSARIWASYYGGSNLDQGNSISSDGSNAWITGSTRSLNFPTWAGPVGSYNQPALKGIADAFIVQFSAAGVRKWASYYGGSALDATYSISSDGSNVWITGQTYSSDLPAPTVSPAGAYQQPFISNGGFISQFSCTNAALIWTTFYGGNNGRTVPFSIQSDGANVWMSGATSSTDFPTMSPACGFFEGTFPAGSTSNLFILQFNTSGVRQWATFYGNDTENEICDGLFSDGKNVFILGDADRVNSHPTMNLAGAHFEGTSTGTENMFIGKFSILCSTSIPVLSTAGGDSICTGGSVTLTAIGAVSYNWSPAAGLSSPTAQNPIANPSSTTIYTVTGTDACGATTTATATVTVLTPIVANASQSSSAGCGAGGGSASVIATGGTGKYTYLWNTGATSQTITGQAAGSYTVTVSDGSPCTQTALVAISTNPSPTINSISSMPLSCNGSANGSAAVLATGGTGTLTYNWSNGSGGTTTITGLTAGTYVVSVTDASGCIAVSIVDVTQPTAILPVASQSTESTCGENNGSATASASGGAGSPYVYNWSNLSSGATAINLLPGTYTVTVVDATNCTVSTTATISSTGPSVSVLSTINNCPGKTTDGALTAGGTGGTGALLYNWSNGTLDPTITGLDVGVYTVTVTDGAGCTATTSASVITLPEPVISVGPGQTITKGQTVELLASSGAASYLWSPSLTLNDPTIYNPIAAPTQTTNYTVTITDGNSCTAEDSVLITVINCDVSAIFMPTAFSPNGDGQNDLLYVRGTTCMPQMHLMIFDRWGELVFETINPATGWDGSFKGKMMNTAVFTYSLTGTLSNGQSISRKGNLTLLR